MVPRDVDVEAKESALPTRLPLSTRLPTPLLLSTKPARKASTPAPSPTTPFADEEPGLELVS